MLARSYPRDSTEMLRRKRGDVEVVCVELDPRVTVLADRDRGLAISWTAWELSPTEASLREQSLAVYPWWE
jgi:hypothetical protein